MRCTRIRYHGSLSESKLVFKMCTGMWWEIVKVDNSKMVMTNWISVVVKTYYRKCCAMQCWGLCLLLDEMWISWDLRLFYYLFSKMLVCCTVLQMGAGGRRKRRETILNPFVTLSAPFRCWLFAYLCTVWKTVPSTHANKVSSNQSIKIHPIKWTKPALVWLEREQWYSKGAVPLRRPNWWV